ncbi:PAH (predicted) [Pycnogonum litorale]
MDQKHQLKMLPKLTEEHLRLNAFSKMRVNLAAHVLSSTVGKIMLQYSHADSSETANFILLVDKFFDCTNTRSLDEAHFKRKPELAPYRSIDDDRFDFLINDFINYFTKWRMSTIGTVGADKKFISIQTYHGLVMTCRSLTDVIKFLLNKGMPYVLTSRFSQDVLESHFGRHRSFGRRADNPNLSQYGYADNTLRVLRDVQFSIMPKGNVTAPKNNSETKTSLVVDETPLKKRKSK